MLDVENTKRNEIIHTLRDVILTDQDRKSLETALGAWNTLDGLWDNLLVNLTFRGTQQVWHHMDIPYRPSMAVTCRFVVCLAATTRSGRQDLNQMCAHTANFQEYSEHN